MVPCLIVCWPRLTAKRVEPVVSISWASCVLCDELTSSIVMSWLEWCDGGNYPPFRCRLLSTTAHGFWSYYAWCELVHSAFLLVITASDEQWNWAVHIFHVLNSRTVVCFPLSYVKVQYIWLYYMKFVCGLMAILRRLPSSSAFHRRLLLSPSAAAVQVHCRCHPSFTT